MNRAFPKWFVVLGWLFYPVAATLILRLLWEKISFALAQEGRPGIIPLFDSHPTLFSIGIVGIILCDLWILAGTVYLIRRRNDLARAEKIQYIVLVLTMLIDVLPTGLFAYFAKSITH